MSAATLGQLAEIAAKLRDVSRSRVQRLIDNWDLAQALMDNDPGSVSREQFLQLLAGTLRVEGPRLFHERWTPPGQQVANLRKWNNQVMGYFLDHQIDNVAAEVPEFIWSRRLEALTLCWTMNSLSQTVATKIELMSTVYGANKVRAAEYCQYIGGTFIQVADGAPEFVPNRLWWEVIDFGSIRNTASDQVDPRRAAGTQVFDAALQHPVAVRSHNGNSDPYWEIPGLRVNGTGSFPLSFPYIRGYSTGGVVCDFAAHSVQGGAQAVVVR